MLTMAQLRTETYKLLNEATNSTLGIVGAGDGTASVSSDTTANNFIAEAVAEICRTCVAYQVSGTLTFGANTRNVLLTSMTSTSPSSATMWFPTDTYIGSTRLLHASESSVRANDLAYASTVVSSSTGITHWYRLDNFSVSLYPYSTTSVGSVTVYGYGIPDVTISDSTQFTFIPDDLMKQMIPSYVATKLAMKNIDDPTVSQRMFWRNWYNEGRMKLYMQLDAGLRQAGGPFSVPPVLGQS
jgi:hypothetical protein